MDQNILDFFAAMGLGISRILSIGLQQNTTWFWLILALVGFVWASVIAATDDEGVFLVIKQLVCILLSTVLLWGTVSVSLAQYSYMQPGKLEGQFNNTQGAALIPTYGVFVVGRQLVISMRGLLAKGQTTSIPNVVAKADLMTSDPDVLDDNQLKANLVIWNQIVAPYLLKQDASLEQSLSAAGLMNEFMVPVPTNHDYTGTAGDNATQVQSLLSKSTVSVGNMLCTLSSLIDTKASQMGATTWTSDTGMCTDTTVKLNLVASTKKAASIPTFFGRPPQAAWDQGVAFTNAMMNGGGISVQSVGSIADLYTNLGQSILYVAGNRYASDSDKMVVLGTACDKMSTSDAAMACNATQAGLVGAANGLVASAAYVGPEDKSGVISKAGTKIGSFFKGIAGWGVTSLFRALMDVLSWIVQSFIPYLLGMAMGLSLVASFLGAYMLLWPRRFVMAVEWMVGPIVYVTLWTVLHGLWTEMDTWIMDCVSLIGFVISADRMLGSNIASILVSVGYLSMPFLAWSLIWGSVGKALMKSTNFQQRMVEAGVGFGMLAARLGIGAMNSADKGPGKSSSPSAGAPSSGSGSGGGSSAPPSSTPAGSIGGTGAGRPGTGSASSVGGTASTSSGGIAPSRATASLPASTSVSGPQSAGSAAGGASATGPASSASAASQLSVSNTGASSSPAPGTASAPPSSTPAGGGTAKSAPAMPPGNQLFTPIPPQK